MASRIPDRSSRMRLPEASPVQRRNGCWGVGRRLHPAHTGKAGAATSGIERGYENARRLEGPGRASRDADQMQGFARRVKATALREFAP